MAQAQIGIVGKNGKITLRDGKEVQWLRQDGKAIVPPGCFGVPNANTKIGQYSNPAIFLSKKPL